MLGTVKNVSVKPFIFVIISFQKGTTDKETVSPSLFEMRKGSLGVTSQCDKEPRFKMYK